MSTTRARHNKSSTGEWLPGVSTERGPYWYRTDSRGETQYKIRDFAEDGESSPEGPTRLEHKTRPAVAPAPGPAVIKAAGEQKTRTESSVTTRVPEIEARRAALRAEEHRLQLEERRRHAEQVAGAIQLEQYTADFEQLGRDARALQEEVVREKVAEKERQEEALRQLRDMAARKGAFAPPPLSRGEMEESVAGMSRFVDGLRAEEQTALVQQTEADLNRRPHDWAFARSWDVQHPGGVDTHDCPACSAWRTWRRGDPSPR
jgi:hypothetical protein